MKNRELEKKVIIEAIDNYPLYTKKQNTVLKNLVIISTKGCSFISVTKLADYCRTSPNSIYRALRIFETDKIIEIKRLGNNRINLFIFNAEKLEEIIKMSKNLKQLKQLNNR